MLAGKVMMDRGAPEALLDTPERGYAETNALIGRWHGRGRLEVAITPRFAPTSTEGQLEAVKALAGEHPGLAIHVPLPRRVYLLQQVRDEVGHAGLHVARRGRRSQRYGAGRGVGGKS